MALAVIKEVPALYSAPCCASIKWGREPFLQATHNLNVVIKTNKQTQNITYLTCRENVIPIVKIEL